MRHEIRVGQQHAGGVRVRWKHADRLARLDQERLLVFQPAKRFDDLVEAGPIARGPADAAVDHKVFGPLGHVGVEVVHQHPQRGLGEPTLGGPFRASRRTDDAMTDRDGWIQTWAASISPRNLTLAVVSPAVNWGHLSLLLWQASSLSKRDGGVISLKSLVGTLY